jgi:hypothetical protein
MIFSENRFPLFGIMLYPPAWAFSRVAVSEIVGSNASGSTLR